jgi:competence protein ComFC
MRCLLCSRWSLGLICGGCRRTLLSPQLHKRELLPGFFVYSFYPYDEIKDLLLTKHHHIGAEIYRILAKTAIAPFAKELDLKAYAIPVDDRLKGGYSHTAILAKAMRSGSIRPRYAALTAASDISYSGKDLAYRLTHPRGFRYRGPKDALILVDDIVTTGTTLKEAWSVCSTAGAQPLFAVTLADADR